MKISIIGSGKVGAAIGYTAALRGLAQELVMVDACAEKARGEALDILQCQAFTPQINIAHGEIADTANSDIVVITAGIPRKADVPRVLLLSRNAELISSLVKSAVNYSPNCIILMVTNPLDVMTELAYKVSGLPSGRVIGMGTVLDTARYRSYLSAAFGVDARDINAFVVGEHGETMVPLISNINVRGIPLAELPSFSAAKLAKVVDDVITASSQVITLKGGTVFAPAASACAIIEAIVQNSQAILPVCTYNEQYGTALSLPTVVGAGGGGKVLALTFSAEEKARLEQSVANIKAFAAGLGQYL